MRELLNMLADEERKHQRAAGAYEDKYLTERQIPGRGIASPAVCAAIRAARAGRADGWFRIHAGAAFAAAFATHKSWDAFLVGMAASIGAGISMGFAESLSDDGSLTGRGPLGFAAR